MSTRDELLTLCNDFAGDLAGAEPDPAAWAEWITYALESLESEAYKRNLDPTHPDRVNLMLERVRDAIADRLNAGRW